MMPTRRELYNRAAHDFNTLLRNIISSFQQKPSCVHDRIFGILALALKIKAKRRRVVIALRMAGIAGQEKLAGIFRRLGTDHNWDITLLRTVQEITPDSMRSALLNGCDGFIVSIPLSKSASSLSARTDAYGVLAAADVPTVVLDIHDPSLAFRKRNIVFVRNSPEEIGHAAADHLIATGRCRSYAFVHNPAVVEWSVERYRAFRETLADHNLWCHELDSPSQIRKLTRPVGVCAANDDCGYEVLEWCRAHRMRVPEDALVVGINNDTLICENCRPRLTSVQPDFEQEGYIAADALSKLMARHMDKKNRFQENREILVGVKEIVRRESTAETSPSGKLVQRAVAYIRRNATKGIGAADVARHLGCSRRLADLRFRELQGTSIGEMLIVTRLEEVKHLLRSTKEPIDTIAAACGFANPNYLKNLFKKRFGMTMRDYRKSL